MEKTPARLDRRGVLVAAGGLAVAGVAAAGVARSARPRAVAGPATGPRDPALRPVSMAMHIHGSFSEGIGSYEAHLDQARRHGVDVIWWTDHDFRVAAHEHRRAVHFTGPVEREGQLTWTWAASTEGDLAASAADFVDRPHGPGDPPTALRLTATGGAAGGLLRYRGTAWNSTYRGSIADTTLHVDVLAEQAGPDATLVVELELSYHPARAGRPAGQYVLRYELGPTDRPGHTADGIVGTVALPCRVGRWQRHTLPLVRDVRRLWPDLVAGDNSLVRFDLAVSVGAGRTGGFLVDRLVFDRARRAGQAGERLRAQVLGGYEGAYPEVTHHRAYEVSLVRHLNWFGGDQTLPGFPSPPYRDNDVSRAEEMVEFLHAHGGVVCWNHPLDVESRQSLARLMVQRGTLGADLVEIGRAPLTDLLWVLDVAARNAVFFTAVGVSDDHAGRDWAGQRDRFVTYAWSTSTGQQDLVAALRAGRAWFTDLVDYRGSLNLLVDGRTAMGGVTVTDAPDVPVRAVATGLPAGAWLEVVTGTVDRAGVADLSPATRTVRVAGVDLARGWHDLRVDTGGYVRTQVRAADGTVLAVSNPCWLLRSVPPRGIPEARRF